MNLWSFLKVWTSSQSHLPPSVRWGNNSDEDAFWDHIQEPLSKVTRWGKYLKADNRLRPQNNLQHTHAFLLLLEYMYTVIGAKLYKRGASSVPNILGLAVAIHDVGEGELKRDVHYIDKADEGDLAEYLAFEKLLPLLPESKRMLFREAFLLQFARRNPSCFPNEARSIMCRLTSRRPNNDLAYAFEAGERIDYVLYAMEQHIVTGNVTLPTQVLRNQLREIRRVVENWRSLKFVWTPNIDDWAETFLVLNDTVAKERKAS